MASDATLTEDRHVCMLYIIKKKRSCTDKKKCITLILTSMLLCETPDVLYSQTSRTLDCTGSLPWICVCEMVKEEILGLLLARVGCQE